MSRIKHKVLFQMDPFNKLNIKTDSTISIIKEALILGIRVYVSNPNDLTLVQKNAFVNFKEVTLINSKFSFSKQKNSSINKFDYFFIRQDNSSQFSGSGKGSGSKKFFLDLENSFFSSSNSNNPKK